MSHIPRLHEYLEAVSSMNSYETLISFFHPDVTFREFPNRIAPNGLVRSASDSKAAYEAARQLMKSHTYRLQRIVESGDELAVELEWTGTLAVPVMNLPAGTEMKAYVAMFLTFRGGKIIEQRNYDCYPPFEKKTE
jgi:ketosteroid isomerase-like protein